MFYCQIRRETRFPFRVKFSFSCAKVMKVHRSDFPSVASAERMGMEMAPALSWRSIISWQRWMYEMKLHTVAGVVT